jgi:hypothetical protein
MREWYEIEKIIEEKNADVLKKYFEKRIYIFGAGILGESLAFTLKHYNCFGAYIDNDINKQRYGVNGLPVISLNKYLEKGNDDFIVIACSEKNRKVIENQLSRYGVKKECFHYIDDFTDDVLPYLAYGKYNEIFVRLAQISLTERCTLRCEKCAHSCYNTNSSSVDLTLEEAKESADYFFTNVDYVDEFVLIGGEPFLYRQIKDIIQYIGSRYRHLISNYSITTNGTIIPDKDVLRACKDNDVIIHISDYSVNIPRLKKRYEELRGVLAENGVRYSFYPSDGVWTDYGIGRINRKATEQELKKIFEGCHTPCREIRKNKYYYCVMARCATDNLNLDIGKDDYLDLSALQKDEMRRMKLLAFQCGLLPKGYLEMCNHCYGSERINHLIPVAIQKR